MENNHRMQVNMVGCGSLAVHVSGASVVIRFSGSVVRQVFYFF
jgi:hypothetical protein